MSSKLPFIPDIPDYGYIRQQMNGDLTYRLENRTHRTSYGRPLYQRINVQLIMTQECPYHCPFCLERQHPMTGNNDFESQQQALLYVLSEHPNARLTITGGEPGLYPEHVKALSGIYTEHSNNVFMSINTAGYDQSLQQYGHINLSVNQYVKPDLSLFKGFTYQTVLQDDEMTVDNIKRIMDENKRYTTQFSFRFLSSLEKHDYPVQIFHELKSDNDIKVHTFRIGDFFTYVTFDYKDCHARIALGDMYQQTHNDYQDGYSNLIIHPNGDIRPNWT